MLNGVVAWTHLKWRNAKNTCLYQDFLLISFTPRIQTTFWADALISVWTESMQLQGKAIQFRFHWSQQNYWLQKQKQAQINTSHAAHLLHLLTEITIVNALPLRAWTTIVA